MSRLHSTASHRPATIRRVLMTADGIGGVWTYALDLCAALRRRGVEVVLATMGARLLADQRQAARERGIEVRESEYRLEWMQDAWRDVDRAGQWLLRLAEELDPDIVHLNGYCHAALPFGRPILVVAHSCVWSWWWAVHGCEPPSGWHEYRARVVAGLRAADRVVAPTHAMLRAIESLYGAVRNGEVIANGRDSSAAHPGAKDEFVLAAGRVWDEAKNLQVLDRVAPRIRWPIRVAGDPCPPEGPPEGRPLALRHVELLGRLSPAALAARMQRAAIFVAPARYEPFGLGPLEAALGGCALVLGDIESLREVWGEHACFVPPDDAEAIARALADLAADPSRRVRLARAARWRALTLEPETMADDYVAAYRRAAHERTRVGPAPAIDEAR